MDVLFFHLVTKGAVAAQAKLPPGTGFEFKLPFRLSESSRETEH
jgi:hypothetical protein